MRCAVGDTWKRNLYKVIDVNPYLYSTCVCGVWKHQHVARQERVNRACCRSYSGIWLGCLHHLQGDREEKSPETGAGGPASSPAVCRGGWSGAGCPGWVGCALTPACQKMLRCSCATDSTKSTFSWDERKMSLQLFSDVSLYHIFKDSGTSELLMVITVFFRLGYLAFHWKFISHPVILFIRLFVCFETFKLAVATVW